MSKHKTLLVVSGIFAAGSYMFAIKRLLWEVQAQNLWISFKKYCGDDTGNHRICQRNTEKTLGQKNSLFYRQTAFTFCEGCLFNCFKKNLNKDFK